ncbi:hypothetical protein [Lentzea sp. NPDC051838]|uniref:hypothetical protein n=1 Tax=Lentzea sp. NPDC051838 TaxID=3154849 RepID=UPI00343C60F1
MSVFVCVECGDPLTENVIALPAVPTRPGHVEGARYAEPTVPLGHYAIEPEPFGAPFVPTDEVVPAYPGGPYLADSGPGFRVSAGPRGTIVLNPADTHLKGHPDRGGGCCGTSSDPEGWNSLCACGAEVGDRLSECYTAWEVHLDPAKVRRVD